MYCVASILLFPLKVPLNYKIVNEDFLNYREKVDQLMKAVKSVDWITNAEEKAIRACQKNWELYESVERIKAITYVCIIKF